MNFGDPSKSSMPSVTTAATPLSASAFATAREYALCDDRRDAAVGKRLSDRTRMPVHLADERRAPCEIFGASEPCQVVAVLVGEQRFGREHLFAQPLLQGQIFGIRAQESHR